MSPREVGLATGGTLAVVVDGSAGPPTDEGSFFDISLTDEGLAILVAGNAGNGVHLPGGLDDARGPRLTGFKGAGLPVSEVGSAEGFLLGLVSSLHTCIAPSNKRAYKTLMRLGITGIQNAVEHEQKVKLDQLDLQSFF